MKSEFLLESQEAIDSAASWLLDQMGEVRILCLRGDLGAGKTTLVSELCRQLGVTDQASSPTYAIVNEYATKAGDSVFHLDLYRIEKEEELFDIGFQEILDSDNFVFIEWPDIGASHIPANSLFLQIDLLDDKRRKLTIFRE